MTLAFYIPMVPFIVFTSQSIAWLVTVIEAVIASAVLCIAIMNPRGDELTSDAAKSGWLLILSVFLRPVLMILGLLAAMLVGYVLFSFINAIYFPVFLSARSDSLFGVMSALAMIAIYIVLVFTTMHKVYDLIGYVPDNLLKFIGGGQESLGHFATEQESKQMIVAAGGQMSHAAQRVGSEATRYRQRPGDQPKPTNKQTGGAGGEGKAGKV